MSRPPSPLSMYIRRLLSEANQAWRDANDTTQNAENRHHALQRYNLTLIRMGHQLRREHTNHHQNTTETPQTQDGSKNVTSSHNM